MNIKRHWFNPGEEGNINETGKEYVLYSDYAREVAYYQKAIHAQEKRIEAIKSFIELPEEKIL